MTQKLIIMTSAIIRGNFHARSIGKFYDNFNKYLLNYDVYHIVNIDAPIQLQQKFSVNETQLLLDNIIPTTIKKIFMSTTTPSFLGAYKNIVNKIDELGLTSENYLYWWFEDDWDCVQYYDIFEHIQLFCSFKNTAMNFTTSSPLGSFRAGPFMSGSYFINYFNIERLGVMNCTCDPEKQVGRWLSGMDRVNGTQKIHRLIDDNNIIKIFFLYLDGQKVDLNDFPKAYYKNKSKFNEKLKFEYYIIKYDTDYSYCNINDIDCCDLSKVTFNEINYDELFKDDCIKYICVKPFVFVDIGRTFNLDNSLKKWEKIGDAVTYI